MNKYNGTLVAVEGIDGAGTTTLCENLKDYYSDSENVIFTMEPSEEFYGTAVRERLGNEHTVTPADFFGFLADRYEHCENVIKPALKKGKTVITDRYDLSTYAYQSKVLDEQLGIIDPEKYIDEMTYHFTIEPDSYIFLDIDADIALERIDGKDKYEEKERLEEAVRMYRYMESKKTNVLRINAIEEEREILSIARTHITNLE